MVPNGDWRTSDEPSRYSGRSVRRPNRVGHGARGDTHCRRDAAADVDDPQRGRCGAFGLGRDPHHDPVAVWRQGKAAVGARIADCALRLAPAVEPFELERRLAAGSIGQHARVADADGGRAVAGLHRYGLADKLRLTHNRESIAIEADGKQAAGSREEQVLQGQRRLEARGDDRL